LEEVKEKLKGALTSNYSDTRLLNFLRFKDYDVDKAAEMIMADNQWRKEIGADEMMNTFPKTERGKIACEYWPNRVHGTDRYGLPVVYDKVGVVDVRSLMQVLSPEEATKVHV